MTTRTSILLCALLPLLAAGCAREPGRQATERPATVAPPAVAFRVPAARPGRLRLEGDTLRFVDCGAPGPGVIVADFPHGEAAAIVRELGGASREIPVLARLDGARLAALRYAGPEGSDCAKLPPGGDVEARGNEPFWSVRIEGGRATMRTPEQPEGVAWEGGAWIEPGPGRWRFTAPRAAGGAADTLVLDLFEERCADSRSGARFPFRATLRCAGRRLDGCGLEGGAAMSARAAAP